MRISISLFASTLRIDVLEARSFQATVNMATTDILVIAAAMSFMPLLSLDAEFRILNDQTGFIIGTSTTISLFLLPPFGVRHNISRAQKSKLAGLYKQIGCVSSANIVELEAEIYTDSHSDDTANSLCPTENVEFFTPLLLPRCTNNESKSTAKTPIKRLS